MAGLVQITGYENTGKGLIAYEGPSKKKKALQKTELNISLFWQAFFFLIRVPFFHLLHFPSTSLKTPQCMHFKLFFYTKQTSLNFIFHELFELPSYPS